MTSKIVFAITLSFILTNVCAQQKIEYKTESAIPYYPELVMQGDTYIQQMCVFDFYYPTNIKDFPTIVWFHGGGLTAGTREIPEFLKDKGFAVIGVGYRLSPKVKVVDCIKDAAAATAWAFKNIEEYGGNTSLVFVSGMSAGGYLAYMVGLDKKYLKIHTIDANQIAGLIPFSGHAITHFTVRKEMGIPGHQPTIDAMAPLYHVRADAPPMLIITGDRKLEMLGRYEENAYMMRMMKVAGHKQVRILELDGFNHGQMMYAALPILYREVKQMSQEIMNLK
ncbi:alpha/beta hydrolase [Cellulophaga sp. F20128]|uniref:alpha/beta hydrolase n=1 Tax=Cellulophaga sp. F20128 TaxID=2926413 RepID=UPI001FF27CE9|nr:alpha/beta hydrolase fold domain-containing protein [Cellulophaga sp. F20128]MCK0157737.1 alpha/beta hydrolase [Cellulophaga sp. F20128]